MVFFSDIFSFSDRAIFDKWQLCAHNRPYIICDTNLNSGRVSPVEILEENVNKLLFKLLESMV
jgi:hypothetical protein